MNYQHFLEIESQMSHIALKQFRLIFKVIQQHSKLAETECGVSCAQLWAVWEIFKKPGIKTTDLAKAMSIHHSTTNTLVNKLSKKGLVTRAKCFRDSRVVNLSLTENGRAFILNNSIEPRGILQQALFKMSDDELGQLSEKLDTLISLMQIDIDDKIIQD